MRFIATLLASLTLFTLFVAVATTRACAADIRATDTVQPLDATLLTAGQWKYESGSVAIAGLVYTGYGRPYAKHGGYPDNSSATFDITGWDRLTARVGLDDNFEQVGAQQTTIEVDGKVVWQQQIISEQGPRAVKLVLSGHKSLTLRWQAGTTVFVETKLTRNTPPAALTGGEKPPATVTAPPAAPVADVIADAKDLDALAAALRKRVDARPELQARVAKGSIALLQFHTVDIAAPSLAAKVAEDLSTSLINNNFPLIERGQLEKALAKLKLPDDGVIDDATASKLGKATGCDLLMVGSITDAGKSLIINVRLLDAATGKALTAERAEVQKK